MRWYNIKYLLILIGKADYNKIQNYISIHIYVYIWMLNKYSNSNIKINFLY